MRYQGHTQDFLHVMRCTDAASNRDGLYTCLHTNSSSMSLKRLKKGLGAPHCTPFFFSLSECSALSVTGATEECFQIHLLNQQFITSFAWGPGQPIKFGIFRLSTSTL